jgi:branched-chain amino acid aminotransferase
MLLPNEKYGEYIWLNGQIYKSTEALIPLMTHGLHYGSCVFEGICAYRGNIFKAQEHYDRLRNSANLLGFSISWSASKLIKATEELLQKMQLNDAYIRPFAWRGGKQVTIGAPDSDIHTAIACWKYSKAVDMAGITMNVSRWRKPPPESIPWESKAAGLYINCTLSKHEALENNCDDALLLDWRGFIAEAASANIFLVINSELHTPIADCFLNGITRQTVIEIAKKKNIPVVERHIKLEELEQAQEVFLTGTASGIMPVRKIGEYNFTPSVITKKIIDAYDEMTKLMHMQVD